MQRRHGDRTVIHVRGTLPIRALHRVHSHGLPRTTNIPPTIRGHRWADSSLRIHGQTTSHTQRRLLKTLHYSRSRSNYPPGLSKGSIVAIGLAVKYPYKIASPFFVSPLGLEERLRWLAANIRVLRALGSVSPIWRSSPIRSTVSCSYVSIITSTAWRTRAYTGTSCSIMTHCHFSLATIIHFHLEGSCSRGL